MPIAIPMAAVQPEQLTHTLSEHTRPSMEKKRWEVLIVRVLLHSARIKKLSYIKNAVA